MSNHTSKATHAIEKETTGLWVICTIACGNSIVEITLGDRSFYELGSNIKGRHKLQVWARLVSFSDESVKLTSLFSGEQH